MSLMTLREMAEKTGVDRSVVLKAIAKEGIASKKVPMPTARGVQNVVTVARADGERLVRKMNRRYQAARKNAAAASANGK